jgi:hypothetical protein
MKAQPLVCSECGQRGDEPPGLTLGEWETLAAVFVLNDAGTGTESVPTPQKVTCNHCGRMWSVARGSVEVR